MAVPKRKVTVSKKKLRTSKKKLLHLNHINCTKCNNVESSLLDIYNIKYIKKPHYICMNCIG